MKVCSMSLKGKYSACFAFLIEVALYPLVSSSFTNPKYAYPLCDSSYAFEIVDGKTAASEHDQCGFHFSGSHPEFSYVPLSFDGVIYPYVDLAVPDDNELKEWSFAAFFRPSSVSGLHAIFHYKYLGFFTEVTEVMLYIDNGIIKLNVVGGSGGSDTAILDMSASVGADYWTFVALSKIYNTGQLKLSMKTETPGVSSKSVSSTTANNFPSDKRLEVPGTIRVGNYHDGGNYGFEGEITCITVYDIDGLANDASEYSLVVDECQKPWGKTPIGLPFPSSTGCATTTTRTNDISSTDDNPASDDNSSTDDNPASDDNSSTDDNPATDDNSSTDNNPATDDNSSTDDNPVTDDNSSTTTTHPPTTTVQQTTTAPKTTTYPQSTTQVETTTPPHTTAQKASTLQTTTPQQITTQQTTPQQISLQPTSPPPTTATWLPITCSRTATAPESMSFRQFPQSNLTGVTTLTPIPKQMVSAVTCALLCSRAISCVAFIVHLVGGIPQSCHLANTFDVSYIISDTDTHLYVQSDC